MLSAHVYPTRSSPHALAGMLQKSVEVQCVQPLTHWDTLQQTCLAHYTGRAHGNKHTALASGPYWPAFAEANGAMPMNTDRHSPCVIQPQANTLRRESKVVTHCCRQRIIYYPKRKRQAENTLHWLNKEILVVTILHRGKIQNKSTTS